MIFRGKVSRKMKRILFSVYQMLLSWFVYALIWLLIIERDSEIRRYGDTNFCSLEKGSFKVGNVIN